GGKFPVSHLAHQQRAPPEVHAPPLGETLLHRIAEGYAVDLVDERDQLAELLADGKAARSADQLLGRLVHIVDRALGAGRDDAFPDRLERDSSLQLAAPERRLDALARADVARDGQQRRTAVPEHAPAVQLRPQSRLLAADELHLERLLRLLAFEERVDVLAHRLTIGRAQQVGHRLADERLRLDAEERAGRAVRIKNGVRVHEHDLGQRLGDDVEQPAVPRYPRPALLLAVDQPVDTRRDVDEVAVPAVQHEPVRPGRTARSE